jgi:hypothetical protein
MPAIAPQTIKGPFEAITAGSADFTWTVGNVAGDTFICTGKEVLLFWNPAGGSTYTVTITSVDDEKGRSEDIATYSMAAGDFAAFGVGLTNALGWKNTSGLVTVTVSNAAVLIAILRMPTGYPA